MPPSSVRRIPGIVDGVLGLAVIAGAAFVLIVNREHPAAWPPGTVAASRAAVVSDPLDPAALRNLGLALDFSGDAASADRMMTIAGARTRRDTPIDAWLLVRRLSQGRYDDAFKNADALLRRDLDDRTHERLFKLLIAAAHYDVSRPALIARLAEAPSWRLTYMRELAATAETVDTRLVFAGLATTAAAPTPPEVDAYLTRLVADKAYVLAARDWNTFSRPRRDANAVGDLSAPPPFGWSPVIGEGASSAVEDGALRVDYDGYGAPTLPTRLIALEPGRYALTWREHVTGDDIHAIAVTLSCAGGATVLAKAAPIESGTPLRERRLDFVVPPTGCEGQTLAIIPIQGDRRAAVTAWFDHWGLTRE